MPRGRKLSLAAALAAGVAVYAVPEPIATTLRAEPRPPSTAEAAIPVLIPPPPDDAANAAAPSAPDEAVQAGASESADADTPEQAADPVQLADAAPFAGNMRTAPADSDWRIAVTVGAADRCAMTAGDDCGLLAIRYRNWDFTIDLGESDDEPLIPAATPVEADAEAPRFVAVPAAADESGAASTPRVIAPPPAVGRIPALRLAPPSPGFAVNPPPPPEEPRRRWWQWRSSRPAVQVAPNAYFDVANVVSTADPPRQVRGSDGALAHFEGGSQVAETPRVRFGLSIPLETLARNRDHRTAAPPPPGLAGPQN